MDGPGSNPGGDEFFRPSRPVMGPNQPPIEWVSALSLGTGGRGVGLTPHLHLVPKGPRKECSYTSTRPKGPAWPMKVSKTCLFLKTSFFRLRSNKEKHSCLLIVGL